MLRKETYCKDEALLAQLPVFYQPWYLNSFGVEWEVFSFNTNNGRWVFPYFKERKLFFKFNRPPIFTPYYGPYLINEKLKENTLDETLANDLATFANTFSSFIITPYYTFDFDILQSKGFKSFEKVTHVLDLKLSEEQLWANMDSKARRNLRKANETLTIKPDEFNVDIYHDWLMQAVKGRNDILHISRDSIAKYVKAVLDNKKGMAATAYNQDGHAVAMHLSLFDKKAAYNILLANNPIYKNNFASTALLWQAIKQAQANDCEVYDFEGSRIAGIADFFRRFGSRRVDFKGYEVIPSKLWRLKNKLSK